MYSRTYKTAIALPPVIWITLFLLLPYALLFAYSFWSVSPDQNIVRNWSFQNYGEIFRNPLYLQVLFRSMRIAASVTILAISLGFPLAYFLSFHCDKHKALIYQLVIIPLWVSYLVRAYAWKTILGSTGVLNTLLIYFHVIQQPAEFLLYSQFAVILTLVHIYTPFTFLPIYAALEHIPRNLMEASQDLGASPIETFRKIILPLAMPGVVAGGTFAFVLSMGDFFSPLLIGGPNGIMISNVVYSVFGAAYNWPLGAAISFCMLATVITILNLAEHLEKRWSFS